jgi:hypothetical protein
MGFTRAFSAAGFVVLLVLSACQPVMVEPTMAEGDGATKVSVIATDEGLQYTGVTETGMPSGLATFSFENERTDAEFAPSILRLNDDTTLDEFVEAAKSENSMSAISLVTLYGGSWLQPGDSMTYETYLTPGDYVFLEQTETGLADMRTFSVMEGDEKSDADVPASDVTVSLQEFAFIMPDTVAAGEHMWRISNDGEQWHEISIIPVSEGTTEADVLDMASDPSSEDEPDAAFQFGPISNGIETWTVVNLEPGTYAALCFLPDVAGDYAPHLEHGMIRVFTVE